HPGNQRTDGPPTSASAAAASRPCALRTGAAPMTAPTRFVDPDPPPAGLGAEVKTECCRVATCVAVDADIGPAALVVDPAWYTVLVPLPSPSPLPFPPPTAA
ncbi:hypothetical protein Vretifemale_3238, partial [Volvox reticuliferus]